MVRIALIVFVGYLPNITQQDKQQVGISFLMDIPWGSSPYLNYLKPCRERNSTNRNLAQKPLQEPKLSMMSQELTS